MMRRYLIACALVLVLHVAAGLGVRPYGDLLIAVGLHVVRANDVADLLDVFMAGAALVGAALLCTTVAFVYVLRWVNSR
jgi:hypothetical protein